MGSSAVGCSSSFPVPVNMMVEERFFILILLCTVSMYLLSIMARVRSSTGASLIESQVLSSSGISHLKLDTLVVITNS